MMNKNRKVRRAVLISLGLTGAAAVSTDATATAITANLTSYVNNASGYTTTVRPTYVWDGGNIGYGNQGVGDCTTNTCGVLPAANQQRVGGANAASGSIQDDRLLAWNHTTLWYTFQITTAGGYTISADRTSTNTFNQPAFSVWSSGANAWNAAGNSHHFNQVQGPTTTNANAYMLAGANPITGFVGYANSGSTFTNGDGDTVLGALSFGTSVKQASDNTLPYNSTVTRGNFIDAHAGAIAAPYAGVGSSVNTSNPKLTNANGGGHADLQLWLPVGWYAMTVGGSCADFTCSATASVNSPYTLKILSNSNITAPVPVPAAVWLFGSALAGLIGIGRRTKQVALWKT